MQKAGKTKNRSWNPSVTIALIAVLMSSISIFISLRETRILAEQQELMASQQEASVWPYLENNQNHVYKDDTIAFFKYEITNKGVGPAILGTNVTAYFDDQAIETWELYSEMRKRYPSLSITQVQNASMKNTVLAPGETLTVVTERLILKPGDTTSLYTVLGEVNDLFRIEYCYCSVYGRCWFVKSVEEVERSTECEFREDIR